MRNRWKQLKAYVACESGAAEIIAVIVLVAVVLILAIAFREQLSGLLSDIWGAIRGRESEITADFEL